MEGDHPRNQLDNVVFQIRFPATLSVDRDVSYFQERVKEDYPIYDAVASILPNVADVPVARNYAFYSKDRTWSVSVSIATLSLSTCRYIDWTDFSAKATALVKNASVCFDIKIATRIGLRYVNAIKPSSMGLRTSDLKGLIDPLYLHEKNHPSGWEIDGFNSSVNYRIDRRSRCRMAYGTIQFADGERGFLIDNDIYTTEPTAIGNIRTILDEFNGFSESAFRHATTEKLQHEVGL